MGSVGGKLECQLRGIPLPLVDALRERARAREKERARERERERERERQAGDRQPGRRACRPAERE